MRPRQAALRPFREHLIAHRGLFDNERAYPENTLAAFDRAVRAGYGIELDVRLTKDKRVVVAHDDTLERICGDPVAVADLTIDQLSAYRVLRSDEPVPTFADVLALVDGRVPLIVEVKQDRDTAETCRLTDQALRGYRGPYCIESFDPRALLWYRRNRPDVIRGQLSDDFRDEPPTTSRVLNWALTNLALSPMTWPDFIAYDHQHAGVAVRVWRAILRCTLVAWTIKSQAQLDAARRRFDVFIFDSFLPDGARDPDGHDA